MRTIVGEANVTWVRKAGEPLVADVNFDEPIITDWEQRVDSKNQQIK